MRRQHPAYHVDAAEFMHLITVGGSSALSSRSRCTASLAGFFDLDPTFDGPCGLRRSLVPPIVNAQYIVELARFHEFL